MAHVEWNVQQNHRDSQGNTRTSTTTYSSHEQYLDSKTVLFGVIDGPTENYPAGEHSYDFAVALPERLPATLKTKDAEIKYKVKVIMDVPLGIDNKESQVFNVANVVDLNQNNALRLAVHLEKIKSFCLFSLVPEEAVVSASVPQGGYTPTEVIPIQCRIHNKTTVSFGSITIELQRKVTATATSPHRTVREYKFKEAESEHIFSEDTRNTLSGVTATIKVPLNCPVSSHFATYIRTEYVLKLQFNVIGCHKNVILRLPIEIGTIAMGAPANAPVPVRASEHIPFPTAPPQEKRPPVDERK